MDTRKRGRAEFGVNAHGGFKKSKPEIDSLSSGIGSKSKPCTKFFSMAGCPFGENCHFLHYFPGGYNAVAQMMNLTPGPATLGKPIIQAQEDPRAIGAIPGCFAARAEPPVPGPAGSFGASATAKISVDASLAGAIIGKGGVNSKQISRQTGAKLAIREHETDPNLRNIELEGTFEQIKQASTMVRELIVSIGSVGGPGKAIGRPGGHAAPGKAIGGHGGHAAPGSNFKTKLCENFSKGSCTFGDRCHFAHGAAELRKTGI
ncbi:zinc finger CCCH domain-containing protein 52 isoform X1 [Sesamum indicum]|uniref:Zinc finger CCCH domain-containing protein 52 isoform X1 n=1 Tax=Sesamum indicum TaxID=4182 RepID=A0A8M8URV2_SESIN|nr:zinc finger CCCH domain-containing protein 52 isoform X1 [Sesamum indicum]